MTDPLSLSMNPCVPEDSGGRDASEVCMAVLYMIVSVYGIFASPVCVCSQSGCAFRFPVLLKTLYSRVSCPPAADIKCAYPFSSNEYFTVRPGVKAPMRSSSRVSYVLLPSRTQLRTVRFEEPLVAVTKGL